MKDAIDLAATAQTKARYNRIARVYDSIESGSERMFKAWRQKLWSQVWGDILEIGVGTGKNLPYYPRGARVIAIDIADRMLDRAQELGVAVDLQERDVQALHFPDNSFDTVIRNRSWGANAA
jgi:ubiquinone/menaquinone biosynthesis C-methylase UbiE